VAPGARADDAHRTAVARRPEPAGAGDKEDEMSNRSLAVARGRSGEEGATTAEYAVCTGAGVGFAGILFKFLTSDFGQQFLKSIWGGIKGLLPF
jgi:hypothetical protein